MKVNGGLSGCGTGIAGVASFNETCFFRTEKRERDNRESYRPTEMRKTLAVGETLKVMYLAIEVGF